MVSLHLYASLTSKKLTFSQSHTKRVYIFLIILILSRTTIIICYILLVKVKHFVNKIMGSHAKTHYNTETNIGMIIWFIHVYTIYCDTFSVSSDNLKCEKHSSLTLIYWEKNVCFKVAFSVRMICLIKLWLRNSSSTFILIFCVNTNSFYHFHFILLFIL